MTIAEVGNGPDRFRGAMEAIASWDKMIGEHPDLLIKVESAADLAAARAPGRCGLIYNFQDTTPLEADPSKAAMFGTLGVKRSEEHTSELPSLMRISYAVFCLKNKNKDT